MPFLWIFYSRCISSTISELLSLFVGQTCPEQECGNRRSHASSCNKVYVPLEPKASCSFPMQISTNEFKMFFFFFENWIKKHVSTQCSYPKQAVQGKTGWCNMFYVCCFDVTGELWPTYLFHWWDTCNLCETFLSGCTRILVTQVRSVDATPAATRPRHFSMMWVFFVVVVCLLDMLSNSSALVCVC